MSDNIIDFTQHLQQSRPNPNHAILVKSYELGPQSLLMDPSFQLDALQNIAFGELTSGEYHAPKIHRLLRVMQYLYQGVVLPFDLRSHVVVRHQPGQKHSLAYSVYNWAMPIGRISAEPTGKRFSYQLEVGLIQLDDMALLEPCGIYPPEWMGFEIAEDDVMTQRLPKHLIKKMNELVVINSGRGILTTDNLYRAILPDSGIHALIITLELEHPITLLPEDQRQPVK